MVPSYWHFALVLVLVLFVSSSVVVTDTPACDSTNDQHCLTPTRKPNVITQQKALIREQQNTRELHAEEHSDHIRNIERTGRDTDRHWDHRQTKFTNRDSPRLYDRIRDVKKTVLDQDNSKRIEETRRHLTGSRRYLNDERLTDLDSSEIEKLGQGTLRERLLNKFALSATEDGYHTARAQRRFSRLRDDVQSARLTTRFERFQQNRMKNLNNKDERDDGSRVVSRFERNRNDRLVRSSKSDVNLRAQTETERLLPRHFRNFDKVRANFDRRESGFERRSAYTALIRNHVRSTDDSVKGEIQKVEPRFEIQRKHRQRLEASLQKENAANAKDDDSQDAFMQNRRMRKDQRREMEERMIREEKQRIYEEERKIREEAKRVREREQRILETEREVKEIIKQIHENERKAREEKQRKFDEEKRLRQQNVERENENPVEQRERFNFYDNEERIYDDENGQYRIDEERNYQNTKKDYDEAREVFDDESDEEDWDYSDYSDSDYSESYEDDKEIHRRIREDIRLFPDIERQIRENVQMYGREYLDAREISSDDIHDSVNEGRQLHNEKREVVDENNNRRKRATENSQIIRTDRRFQNSLERKSKEGQRQIAERRSFRSQDERLTRRINLRQMNEERQFANENTDSNTRQEGDRRLENLRNGRIELERSERRNELERTEGNRERREENRRIELEWSEGNRERREENRRNELERSEGNRERREENRRIERNLERRDNNQRMDREMYERSNKQREENRRIEDSRNRRIDLERSERNNEQRENDRQMELNKIERNNERRKDNRQIESEKSERSHEEINILLKSPVTEFSIWSEQKQKMFESVNFLLQASFIGILVLKVLTEQEFMMKKLRSLSLLKRFESVLNNVISY